VKKEYLGDGVYVEVEMKENVVLKLTTSNGIEDTNTIILDVYVLSSLEVYINKLLAERNK